MFHPKGALAPEEDLGVAPGEDALHGVAGRVPGGRGALLPARAAEVIVVADETLEPSTSKIAFHAGVTRHALVTGHHSSSGKLAHCRKGKNKYFLCRSQR